MTKKLWLVVAVGMPMQSDMSIIAAHPELLSLISCTGLDYCADFCPTDEGLPRDPGFFTTSGHIDESDPEEWAFVRDAEWRRLTPEEAADLANGAFEPKRAAGAN